MKLIDDVTAEEIWQVLVERCNASASRDDREAFVHYATGRVTIPEYRFGGVLGFGGKVRINEDRWRVDYYPEDKTELLDTLAANANYDLAQLKQNFDAE